MGERPTPDSPHPGRRRPPRPPSWRPHSPQSQLARARPLGLLTGPHPRSPRTHSHRIVDPGRTPERTIGRGWESAQPRTPHTQARGAPPPGALVPPPQRARARAVGLVTGPHARIPRNHRQWVVGPGCTPERTSGRGWESARPRTPHTQARGPPPGTLMRPPQRAKPARKSARCGVGDGSPGPHPPHLQPVGTGPRPHARTDERSGLGERPSPDAPHPGKRPSPGSLMPPPQRAKPGRSGGRCGVGDGSPGPHPPHPQPVSSGPRPHARTDKRSGVGERPSLEAAHPGKRRPPGAPSCRTHSAQSQLARARAVGLVTGPHARTPRTHRQWVVGPGRTPEKMSGRGRESAGPRTPHSQARGAPPRHSHAAPTARKSARCGVGDGPPRPHPPHPKQVGNVPRPHARTDERSGVGEHPSPDAPHQGKRRPPRAPSCRPHSAQRQLARAHAVGLVTGPRARTPRTHSQWVVGPGRTPERTRGQGWESARPRTAPTQAGGAPLGHPHGAPTARKASSQEHALWGC